LKPPLPFLSHKNRLSYCTYPIIFFLYKYYFSFFYSAFFEISFYFWYVRYVQGRKEISLIWRNINQQGSLDLKETVWNASDWNDYFALSSRAAERGLWKREARERNRGNRYAGGNRCAGSPCPAYCAAV
jgi:hypothetical protein